MDTVLQGLKNWFGFDAFRPGQEAVVRHILGGGSLLSVMPTGAGKSLSYQLPAMLLPGCTIIISPLVALMDDQVAALKALDLPAAALHSHKSSEDQRETLRGLRTGDIRLLYVSPERLMTDGLMRDLHELHISLFVVDEAHCVSKWGQSFRPDYVSLSRLKTLFPHTPVAAFTATADEQTRQDIRSQLMAGDAPIWVQGFDRPNLSLAVEPKVGLARRLKDFIDVRPNQAGIIYALSRKQTEGLAADLGPRALAYHAGMDPARRQAAQDRFMTEPGLVMVATIAFGMGIDKPDIRFVLHASLPSSMEAFYQEIGRAGRDGAAAETCLFFGMDDFVMRQRMIADGEGEAMYKEQERARLTALLAYAEAPGCRRQVLLRYFDEDPEPCGNCDNCLKPPELADGKILAQKALSAIARTGEYFGASHIIDVLRGAKTAKIKERQHDELPTYGIGQDLTKPHWQTLLNQLLATGHVWSDPERHGALRRTETGQQLMKGQLEFPYRKPSEKLLAEAATRSPAKKLPTVAPEDEALLLDLKAKRLSLAKEADVPAFVIFADRSLMDMAAKRPQTKAQMMEVSGVGPAKWEKYGAEFLEICQEVIT